MRRIFSAPGKAVIVGEYAVLDGAPAVVAAINAGVRLRVDDAMTFTVKVAEGDTRYVDAVFAQYPNIKASLHFESYNQPQLGGKLGLGGSAAATVVSVYAAAALTGETREVLDIFRRASDLHYKVQGSGSGIDIAASTYGGLLRYSPNGTPRPLPTPEGVLRLVWSGKSAATGPRAERYLKWRDRCSFVDDSAAIVADFTSDPMGSIRENVRLLTAMANEARIDYTSPVFDTIGKIAHDVGGAAKPSGAGGGDIAIAWLGSEDQALAFDKQCRAAGILPLASLGLDPQGVRDATAAQEQP